MVPCTQSTIVTIVIAYLLLGEHKEVDPFFFSSFFQVVPGVLLPPLFDHLLEVFFVVGDGESGCVGDGETRCFG